MSAARLVSSGTFASSSWFLFRAAKQRGGDGNSGADVPRLCEELELQLGGLPGGFSPQTPVLPGRVMSPEVLWAVYITGVPSSAENDGGSHGVSRGAQRLSAGARCWPGWEKPWIWVETPSKAGGAVPGV